MTDRNEAPTLELTPHSATGPSSRQRMPHPYEGRTAVLATMHDKLPLVAPTIHAAVGLEIRSVHVDTDRLGTFSGEVPRPGTPWETAVTKARLGMSAAGSALGFASEGTVGTPAGLAFVVAATELVVFIDDELGITVGEYTTSYDIVTIARRVTADECLDDLLFRGDFPNHAMIVRPADGTAWSTHKGIHDRAVLDRAVRECAAVSSDQQARVETDLRAHHCPSRRPVIADAAARLARRLATRCPQCATPGWGVVRINTGVPCHYCHQPVDIACSDEYGCPLCDASTTIARPTTGAADPALCQWCNP